VPNSIRDFVMGHALFCHHDHHFNFRQFDRERESYDYRSLLGGYAESDLTTAAGARPPSDRDEAASVAALWPKIRTTGYGRAVALGCRELFDLDYSPENFAQITEALQASIAGKSAAEAYDYFVSQKANTRWVLNDSHTYGNDPAQFAPGSYPDYYRFTWRMDSLWAMLDRGPIDELERATGLSITSLDRFVTAMNAGITRFKEAVPLAAIKIAMAYYRDLAVADPTRHEAEAAFNRIVSRPTVHDPIQQDSGAVSAREARPLSDYLFHRLMQRADDEDLPVQIHTGYLAGNWGSLTSTKASYLIPVFEKYRRVRFDVMHASMPWTSEIGAIAKNYPNVYPDLCWAWTMNPAHSERTLSEWLDAVPFNKIFGYGADTGRPWCDVGYALQARIGIARVLEQKIEAGYFSPATAEDVAAAIMLHNGEELLAVP
jgi:predicted TIM-barrel fold metal-dependent hydrolase